MHIIVAIICIGILIFVHELGHFAAARTFGVAVYRFAIGFPPKVFSVTRKGIVYALNLIPLGGYVSIKGFASDDAHNEGLVVVGKSYQEVSLIKKMIIVLAGIAANIIFAYLIFVFLFVKGMAVPMAGIDPDLARHTRNPYVQVSGVVQGAAAHNAGLSFGDRIKSITDRDGNRITPTTQAVFEAFQKAKDKGLMFTLQSSDIDRTVIVVPILQGDGTYKAGLMLETYATVRAPFGKSLTLAAQTTAVTIHDTFAGLGQLVEKLFTKKHANVTVSGPVGIITMTGQLASFGFRYLLSFLAVLSLNLAVLNILPIPPLDGWHAVRAIYKSIFKRDLPALIETIISAIGILLVLALIVYASIGDIKALL